MRFRAFLAAAIAAAGARASAQPAFRYERTVVPGAAGSNRLAVDADLLARAKPVAANRAGGLEDLRLFDAAGTEVPYLLVAPEARAREWMPGRLIPITATKSASGFEADLGKVVAVDRVSVSGIRAPFLKRFRLEGSGDRARWVALVAEGTLFDLPDQKLRDLEASFAAGPYRYLRLTWDDRQSARVAGTVRVMARRAATGEPERARVAASFERLSSEPGKSRFRVRLPGPRLPVSAIELSVSRGNVFRAAEVTEPRLSEGAISPVRLGNAVLRRAQVGELAANALRVPIDPPQGDELDLLVEDGDNPPLALSGVAAELAPVPWIYFESPGATPLVARFGDPALGAPRYDIEAMRRYVKSRSVAAAAWGPVRDLSPAPPAGAPLADLGGAPLDASRFAHRRAISGSPAGLNALGLDAAILAGVDEVDQVRIVDGSGRQIPFVVERRAEPLSIDLPMPRRAASHGSGPTVSTYRLDLPYAHLPESHLVLSTLARVFERRVAVSGLSDDSTQNDPSSDDLARSTWSHADPHEAATALSLPLPKLSGKELEIRIDEGDNGPLPLDRPRLLLPSWRLRFYRAAGESLWLVYGDPAVGPPKYDISLLAAHVLGSPATEVSLAPERHVRAGTFTDEGRQRGVFWGVLILSAILLAAFVVKLVRRAEV